MHSTINLTFTYKTNLTKQSFFYLVIEESMAQLLYWVALDPKDVGNNVASECICCVQVFLKSGWNAIRPSVQGPEQALLAGTQHDEKEHQISVLIHSKSSLKTALLPVTHTHTRVTTSRAHGYRGFKNQNENVAVQSQAPSSSMRNKIPTKCCTRKAQKGGSKTQAWKWRVCEESCWLGDVSWTDVEFTQAL